MSDFEFVLRTPTLRAGSRFGIEEAVKQEGQELE